jgi:GNAT superfamily N-acetyltransferase
MVLRGTGTTERPALHWLAVHPQWRRRGVGRRLVATLERAAWDAGYREIVAETHADWRAAAAFYERLGYRPVRSSR